MRKIAVIIIAGLFTFIAAYLYYKTFEPNRDTYPIRGIDVSHHQGKIDWKTVSENDVKFVYIKATEGAEFNDKRFAENLQGAQAANIPAGAYHFYTLCTNGSAQADNFIHTVPVSVNLPPVIDLEFGGNCGKRPTQQEFEGNLNIFINKITLHYGKQPIFYLTKEFQEEYMNTPTFANYKVWIRSIILKPEKPQNWLIWQYHNRGSVKGITGPVDLNVLNSNASLNF